MIQRLRTRITQSEKQGGFTLIELLVVIIIIGILLAIAIPSYLKFRENANESAAKANVRAAIPAIEEYYNKNNKYTDISLAKLKEIDAGVENVTVTSSAADTYCVTSTVGQAQFRKNGPGGKIEAGGCGS